MDSPSIGRSVPRREGRDKVTGAARYIDDIRLPGMLYGATVRSTQPRGVIRDVVFEDGVPWDEFVVVTAADIPGRNCIALIENDQPCLAAGRVNHPEEPVVLLAHADRFLLEEARRRVRVEVDPEPAVFDLEESLAGREVVWGADNVFKSILIEKGDVDAAFASAALVVEGEYFTGAQEQLYIETNGMIAVASPEEGVTVWGSLQCPYYVQKALTAVFDLPPERARVVQAETGGGFGGKEEYPSAIAAHAALLAWKAGRPVKLIYDRAEDMVATTKRHPSRTRHRTALDAGGRLLGMDLDFAIDGGAYMTLSPVVLSRGAIHAAGPYSCPNVRVRARAVATNHPPHGAFRGFGAPQSLFALERHMNRVARAAGLAPEELRRRNFLRRGDATATGQVIRDDLDMAGIMDFALAESRYHEKVRLFAEQNRPARVKKGIGFAAFMHGAGFTGSGEKFLESVVGAEVTESGAVRVLAASTEIGQGTTTIFSQIAADALGLPCEAIEIARPDTGDVPNSGPTVASRTCMVVGKLVESSALAIRRKLADAGLLGEAYTPDEFAAAARRYLAEYGPLKTTSTYAQPSDVNWDDKTYRGDAYAAYSWAVHLAEVSVDTVTYEVRVDDFVAVQEVGKVVHPVFAAGQIEGGVAQAIGFALYENVVWRDGRMANGTMTNYIVPTSVDTPPIRVFFFENPSRHGPGGAKGIGELPMDGAAPAILNALECALGSRRGDFRLVPLTPEDVMRGVEAGDE
jgi:CO/xanthine dehydrogenase Mo-binding subunit